MIFWIIAIGIFIGLIFTAIVFFCWSVIDLKASQETYCISMQNDENHDI